MTHTPPNGRWLPCILQKVSEMKVRRVAETMETSSMMMVSTVFISARAISSKWMRVVKEESVVRIIS